MDRYARHTFQRRHLIFAPTALRHMSNLGEPELGRMTMVVKAQSNQPCQYSTNLAMLLDNAKINGD